MSSADKTAFPLELLTATPEERVNYFFRYKTLHPRLQEVDKYLWRAIHTRLEDTIIFLFGPTGVGKTTLTEGIKRGLIKEARRNLSEAENKQRAPFLCVEAPSPEGGRFDWRDFYRRSLAELEHPFIENIETDSLPFIPPRLANALGYSSRLPYSDFRLGLESALRIRQPVTFMIDDAQHIGKMGLGRRTQDQVDVIKSLIRRSNTLITLVGTYELMSLRNLSGQLSRRSIDIHFPRYGSSPEDLQDFQNVLWTFQKHLPVMVEPDLMKNWEYCYVYSVGCVGILKDWLTRALEEAVSENASSITVDILERNALTLDQCETIAAEALEGERRMLRRRGASTRLVQMLGFTKVPQPAKNLKETPALETREYEFSAANPRLPIPVGRRKPTRDKAGRT